jgi:hypothetical protein
MRFGIFFRKLQRLDGASVALLLEAAAELLFSWIVIRTQPFRTIAARLGKTGTVAVADCSRFSEAARIRWAVAAVSRRTPWASTCLMQALSAQRMLRRRGAPATVYLAMLESGKRPDTPLLAHAWVRCGDLVITGQCDESQYRVIATFA